MRHRPRCAVAVALIAALAVAGCADAEPSRPVVATVLDCVLPIDELDTPPDGWVTVADVMALPDDLILQRGRSEDSRRFSKFGLVVRTNRSFNISIAAKSQPNALMGWGTNSRALSTSIDIPGCPPRTGGEWVVYPGGVWTMEPACVTIELASDDETVTARLPIGEACVT